MARKTKMNSITSPELLAQVNPNNTQLLNDFLDYLRSVQRSETTIAGYESDIQIAFVWCLQYNDNKFFVDWTKRNVVAFQNWLLNENGNSPARVRRLKSSLSSMSNFVCNVLDDEYPNFRNIIRKIEDPVLQPVREKTIYSEDEIETLLDTLVGKKQYERACAVALAAYSGRRKSELPRFRVSDFGDDKLICDGALYKSAPIKTKGHGGGKFIPCYTLAKRFKPYLDMWMAYREEHGIESEWLLMNPANTSEPLSVATLDSWAGVFTRITGKDFYFHSLRHFYTSLLSSSGIPDGVIAEIVGWSDVSLVAVYDDTPSDEKIGRWFKDGDIAADNSSSLNDI